MLNKFLVVAVTANRNSSPNSPKDVDILEKKMLSLVRAESFDMGLIYLAILAFQNISYEDV
jgi:hypothetical protein